MKSVKNRNGRETVLNIINKYCDRGDKCIKFFVKAKGLTAVELSELDINYKTTYLFLINADI